MLKLLLVDDESNVREHIRTLVNWEKFNITVIGSCDNALAALEILTDEQPDILLTDIKMPVMDGIELSAKAIGMYPAIQCILLSGYSEFNLAQEAMKQGIRHYLLKPCSKAEIEEVLEACSRQILLESEGTLYRFDRRRHLISQIVCELLNLQPDESGTVLPAQIMELSRPYLDLGLLQEAFAIIVSQNNSLLDQREFLAKISESFYDEKNIYANIASALTEIFRRSEGSSVIEEVTAYIKANFDNPNLTLKYIADHVAHMNSHYLGKLFYRQVGMKFSEYTMDIRMKRAISILESNPDTKMYKIAEHIGLGHSVQYFYQLFKKYTGMTPTEYKEANK